MDLLLALAIGGGIGGFIWLLSRLPRSGRSQTTSGDDGSGMHSSASHSIESYAKK